MKNVKKNFVLTALSVLLSVSALLAGTPEKENDPRIQSKNNKVTIALLNLNQDSYKVKIYSSKNKLVHEEILINKSHLIGKMFDFNSSVEDYYRISIVSEGETLFEKRLFLGN